MMDGVFDVIVLRGDAGTILWHRAHDVTLFNMLKHAVVEGRRIEILGYHPNTTNYDQRLAIIRAYWTAYKDQDQ